MKRESYATRNPLHLEKLECRAMMAGDLILGADQLGVGYVESWRSNLIVDEGDLFKNETDEIAQFRVSEFAFTAARNQAPITPFLVKVHGDNDFRVVTVGTTRQPYSYKTGQNSFPFRNQGATVTLKPGEALAAGFLDANANGKKGGASSVIPYRLGNANDEVWWTGGPKGRNAGRIVHGQAPFTGSYTRTFYRNYQFQIALSKIGNSSNNTSGHHGSATVSGQDFHLGNLRGARTLDRWRSNLVINITDTYSNPTAEPKTIEVETFEFNASRRSSPLTPFVVRVGAGHHFQVIAIGQTVTKTQYRLGHNSVPFSKSGTTELTLAPGDTIAVGFVDAKANGRGGNFSAVIPFRQDRNSGQAWKTGGLFGRHAGGVFLNQPPKQGTKTRVIQRDYDFRISFTDQSVSASPPVASGQSPTSKTKGTTPGMVISEDNVVISENGSRKLTLRLSNHPPTNYIAKLRLSDATEARISATELAFGASDWNKPYSVLIHGVDDEARDGSQNSSLSIQLVDVTSSKIIQESIVAINTLDDGRHLTIQEQIDRGRAQGRTQIVLEPDVYYAAPVSNVAPHVAIRGARDLSIIADDVTLVGTELNTGVTVIDSQNVEIRGLTVDYDPLPFTQGTIVRVASNGKSFDVRIHDGYDVLPSGTITRAIIHDPVTRHVKADTISRFNATTTVLGNNLMRISREFSLFDKMDVGDLVSLTKQITTPHAFYVSNSYDIEFSDITIHASTSFGVLEIGGGENSYDNISVTPGKTPKGANEPRLLSTNYDGLHSKYASVGPQVTNSSFDKMGDDGIAINGDYFLAARVSGNSMVLATKFHDQFRIEAGDKLRAYDSRNGQLYEAIVQTVQPYTANDIHFAQLRDQYLPNLIVKSNRYETGIEVTLHTPLHIPAGSIVSNPDRNGSGFEIRNNTITDTRARGMLLKASDGMVIDNTLSQIATAGIVLSPEPTKWMEADFSHSVQIRNNHIFDVGFTFWKFKHHVTGGIAVTAPSDWPMVAHRDIIIADNRLERVWGVNLQITNASNVLVTDNEFVNPHQFYQGVIGDVPLDTVVWVHRSDGVEFRDNTVFGFGFYGNQILKASASNTNLEGKNSGVAISGTSPLVP